MEKVKKRNQIFNYLYVLAIIMVIDDHVNTRIGILSSIFPYNSFYMPLFVFASGYFYRKMGLFENIKHKIKKLLVPYLIWNIIAAFLAFLLDHTIGINWIKKSSIKQILITTFFSGSLTSLNGAAWFVIMLFWVSIIYNLINYKIKDNKKFDLTLTIFLILLGFLSLYLCTHQYATRSVWWIFALKIAFYIQFYHFGVIFRKYAEKRLLSCNKLLVISLCIIINVVLICIYGGAINFVATSSMNHFNNWYLPLVTSITGIVFWYEIMEFLSRKIGENRIVNFISRNTFVILETHLLFANIPNFFVYFRKNSGGGHYIDFNIDRFIDGAWVRYNSNTLLIGFFCGLIGSLAVAYIIEKVKLYFAERRKLKLDA